jgi:hypothetical protein
MEWEFSRRRFLALGAAAAGVLAAPSVVSAAAGADAAGPRRPVGVGSRSFPYALATWQGLQGGRIRLEPSSGRPGTLRIDKVTDLAPSGASSRDGEVFSVTFSGGRSSPGEGTHTLSHGSMGQFPLFLTQGENGTLSALINRSHGAGR